MNTHSKKACVYRRAISSPLLKCAISSPSHASPLHEIARPHVDEPFRHLSVPTSHHVCSACDAAAAAAAAASAFGRCCAEIPQRSFTRRKRQCSGSIGPVLRALSRLK